MFVRLDELLPHLTTALLVVALMVAGRIFMQYRAHKRSERDAAAVATGLRIELTALRALYEENIDLIERSAGCLLSARSMNSFYKRHVGRVSFLFGERILVPVVTAFTRNEMLEVHLSAACIKQNGTFAYRVRPGTPQLRRLGEEYRQACRGIEEAIEVLDPLTRPLTRGEPGPASADAGSVVGQPAALTSGNPV